MVRGELDYGAERRSMDAMKTFFEGSLGVRVPRSAPAYCTPRVLSAELVQARKLTVVLDELALRRDEGDEEASAQLSDLLGRMLEVYVRKILEAGAFQADPHPGNFLVAEDGTLVLLDFGATRHLSDKTRRSYVSLVHAVLVRDDARVAATLHRIGLRTKSGDPSSLVVFADAVMEVFRDAMAKGGAITWPTPEQALAQAQTILGAAQRDPVVSLPGEIVMILRVFGTLGGLFGHYKPEIDVTSRLLPTVLGALASVPDSTPPPRMS
jgi:ubiquinone biosynthesis protein